MEKTSTVRTIGNKIFKGHKLTIGVDLGDNWSCYCVLDEAGKVILEQKVAMTPEAMKQTFGKAILVRNFSVKSRRGRNKGEGTKKKGDGIQTAELDRRDQVTATKSWPNFPSRE